MKKIIIFKVNKAKEKLYWVCVSVLLAFLLQCPSHNALPDQKSNYDDYNDDDFYGDSRWLKITTIKIIKIIKIFKIIKYKPRSTQINQDH